MERKRIAVWTITLLTGALLSIFLPLPLTLRSLAVFVVTAYVPGFLLVEWLVGGNAHRPEPLEHLLYSISAGYGVAVVVTLMLSYLPGGLSAFHMVVAYGLVAGVLLWLVWRREDGLDIRRHGSSPEWPSLWREGKRRWGLLGLAVLLLVGAFFRLPNLGYSEFQGDEARAALRAAGVIQGREEVLLIHKKGPTEILLPTNLYALTGRLNETGARVPFALANVVGLVATFVLGWRLFGPVAGWAAAMLLAVDGYLVGFSRIVQYQSVVFLTNVVVVLILYRTARWPAGRKRYWVLAALVLTAGLFAHYEAIVVALPALLFMVWGAWRQREPWSRLILDLVPALLLGGALLALFYVPFVLHPNFAATYAYLTQRRIGGQFPYNNLTDFFLRTTVYSSTYYLVTMIGLATIGLIQACRRGGGRLAWPLAVASVAGLSITALNPSWLTVSGRDFTVLVFLGLFALAWFAPRMAHEERTIWAWFGSTALLALFLTEKPRSHVYIFFMPWALLSGLVIGRGFDALRGRLGLGRAVAVSTVGALLGLVLFGTYIYFYFVYNRVEILRTWQQNRLPGYWVVYDEPEDKAIFGFPLRNGWKVVGALYAQGVLSGIYETNEKEAWVPDWYTRGQERCLRDHTLFFFIDNLEPEGEEERRLLQEKLRREYQLFGSDHQRPATHGDLPQGGSPPHASHLLRGGV
ncbi:MAG: glycosyltransferase family 39 protein [Ardenticatenia bacterium]|nr:glycosyltransferase family 39 protein [Ardenticatenia bacterium]